MDFNAGAEAMNDQQFDKLTESLSGLVFAVVMACRALPSDELIAFLTATIKWLPQHLKSEMDDDAKAFHEMITKHAREIQVIFEGNAGHTLGDLLKDFREERS